MDVSVIIPTRNKKDDLRRCLQAVLAQQLHGAFEVLVCDDGSTDGTPEWIGRWFASESRLRCLSQAPRGPAAARNLGIRRARAPLIAMTDDDTIPQPGWLEALRVAAGFQGPPDGVLGVEGRVTAGRPLGPCETAPVNDSGGVYLTCNALYRRDALIEAGGFDERFPFPAFEDCDLAARIGHRGIAWAPDAVVVHPPRLVTWQTMLARFRYLPWAMVTARRYGYFGWPRFPTRRPRAASLANAVVKLPAGRFLSAVRSLAAHPGPALRAAIRALAEPFAALALAAPRLLRFDLESAALQMDSLGLASPQARVGLVIVHYRRPDQLLRCLRSFEAVRCPNLARIVVANETRPQEADRLRRELPAVEWVVSRENLGYTGGNNLGIERALELGCDYILVMNDDTVLLNPDFITGLVRFLELNPAVALAGPRVHLREPGRIQNTVLRCPSLLGNVLDWFGFRLFPGLYERSGDAVRPAEMLNGVCVMLRAAAVRQVGAFDPLFFNYIEDADLGLRLRSRGWTIAYLPIDSIVHLQKETGYDLYGWASLLLRRNAVYFLRKHRRPAQAWMLAAANMLLTLGRTCLSASRPDFRRRLDFSRALWRELRAVLWTGSWNPAPAWKPQSE